jgi:Transcription factor WhiB
VDEDRDRPYGRGGTVDDHPDCGSSHSVVFEDRRQGGVGGRAVSDWLELAACRGKPTAWWFPDQYDRFGTAVAQAVCRSCPVRGECLAEALDVERLGVGVEGVYGGLTAAQRRRLLSADAGDATLNVRDQLPDQARREVPGDRLGQCIDRVPYLA